MQEDNKNNSIVAAGLVTVMTLIGFSQLASYNPAVFFIGGPMMFTVTGIIATRESDDEKQKKTEAQNQLEGLEELKKLLPN